MTFVPTQRRLDDNDILVPDEGVYFRDIGRAPWFREWGPIFPLKTKHSLLLLWHSYSAALWSRSRLESEKARIVEPKTPDLDDVANPLTRLNNEWSIACAVVVGVRLEVAHGLCHVTV
jgi:hypothetical protein